MTLNDIEILIHFRCSCAEHPRKDSPAVIESIEMMIREGLLIKTTQGNIVATDKGKIHLQHLCDTPLPINALVIANGKIITQEVL